MSPITPARRAAMVARVRAETRAYLAGARKRSRAAHQRAYREDLGCRKMRAHMLAIIDAAAALEWPAERIIDALREALEGA
jgi:hypothetical protein